MCNRIIRVAMVALLLGLIAGGCGGITGEVVDPGTLTSPSVSMQGIGFESELSSFSFGETLEMASGIAGHGIEDAAVSFVSIHWNDDRVTRLVVEAVAADGRRIQIAAPEIPGANARAQVGVFPGSPDRGMRSVSLGALCAALDRVSLSELARQCSGETEQPQGAEAWIESDIRSLEAMRDLSVGTIGGTSERVFSLSPGHGLIPLSPDTTAEDVIPASGLFLWFVGPSEETPPVGTGSSTSTARSPSTPAAYVLVRSDQLD